MRLFCLLFAILVLASCASPRPNYYDMSEEELANYNAERSLPNKVYCYVRRESSSWIPRRFCATIAEHAEEAERNARRIEVMSPNSNYSVLRGGN